MLPRSRNLLRFLAPVNRNRRHPSRPLAAIFHAIDHCAPTLERIRAALDPAQVPAPKKLPMVRRATKFPNQTLALVLRTKHVGIPQPAHALTIRAPATLAPEFRGTIARSESWRKLATHSPDMNEPDAAAPRGR